MRRNVILIVRDGWGLAPPGPYNAVSLAKKPNDDLLRQRYPHTVLEASGPAVGLPDGCQGSSEVGHLNIGAGRIVEQEIKRINDSLEQGSLFSSPMFRRAVENCTGRQTTLHLMGLVQDEGVHAHQDHLYSLLARSKQEGIQRVLIHFFADGRDTPPRSALVFLRQLRQCIQKLGTGEISTVMGRYYAMDRSRNYALTDQAYEALTRAEGIRVESAEAAIERAYREDRTPDGTEMVDEYIPPTIVGNFAGIKDGDSIIHFNFRQDRAVQLSQAFVEENYPGRRWKKLDVVYAGLTRYYDQFPYNILPAMDQAAGMQDLLGEVLSKRKLRQLRISETQKFRHVTSFFNGKRTMPYEGEDQIEIPSTLDAGLYAVYPEMNADKVTREVIRRINSREYHFIVLNYPNCDMVGHTGALAAAIRAVAVVDECVGRVVDAVLDKGGVALVTADHGNAEEMFEETSQVPKTSHTTNPVEFFYVAKESPGSRLRPRGILSDIAPTVLEFFEIPKPAGMTSTSLLVPGLKDS
ncbi:MAG: 2,3-bisphosphoglycerate-independent phosphoglycerate mutase [Syntrophobacteria bacterium]